MNSLFVAWRPGAPEQTGWRPGGRLEHDGGLYRFCYTRGAHRAGFHPFAGMDRLDQIYESEELLPLFANRLLSDSRPEYEAWLRWSGFSACDRPDPIAALGVTEGIRQTDAVEVFPCPAPDTEGCYSNKFFLHGIHLLPDTTVDRIGKLAEGERLMMMFDVQNEHDSQAVAVRTHNEPTLIGYVPRYLAHEVGRLALECDFGFFDVSVDRVNGDAPFQNRLLCRVRACWPDGFQPCDGDDFLPIPALVAARCGHV